MDRFGGHFGAHDDAEPLGSCPLDDADDPADPLPPPSPVGQDERRMQVRAYNHWASLLGSANFPAIADLHPETLEDFGPHGVLLDFTGGIDDPAVRFLGARLAEECGADTQIRRLSDVPGRSLLSRITDHYLQIMANQAPIGFEAEFVNRRGAPVLYRGILLPWSSDGAAIDFIFGVINWKEQADAATADALLLAIDAALDPTAPSRCTVEGAAQSKDDPMDRMLDPTGFGNKNETGDEGVESLAHRDAGLEPETALPAPAFGAPPAPDEDEPLDLFEEAGEEEDEDAGEGSEWGAGFSGFGDEDTVYSVDYGELGLEDGEAEEDVDGVVDPLGDQGALDEAPAGLAALVSRGIRTKASVVLPGATAGAEPAPAAGHAVPQAYEPEPVAVEAPTAVTAIGSARAACFDEAEASAPEPVLELADDAFAIFADDGPAGDPPEEETALGEAEPDGLYDCLAAARELAQTARSSEDRGRKALYQAVSRAYDFSLEAAANPDDFDELLAENGLTVQDRAPMTPVVKLVFGADYDKTRLTEYATVLGFAHRTGVARGTLGRVLSEAEGGLKGVVQAERRARKEALGAPAEPGDAIRPALAKKLRARERVALDELAAEGPEFALVMVRRLASGELAVLGEVRHDKALVERAARRLLG